MRLGSGTPIEAIRLGDGTPIGTVRKGDGTELWSAGPALPDSVVDNFERDNPLNDYTGATGDYSTTTTDTLEGEKSLTADSYGADLIATSTLVDALPSQGDVFSCLIQDNDGTSRQQVHFGVTDTNNFYEVGVDSNNDEIRMRKKDSGGFTTLDSDGLSVGTGTREVEITWKDDDTIEARIYNWDTANDERGSQIGATLSATDNTHAGVKGIGFRADGLNSISAGDLLWDRYWVLDEGGA